MFKFISVFNTEKHLLILNLDYTIKFILNPYYKLSTN